MQILGLAEVLAAGAHSVAAPWVSGAEKSQRAFEFTMMLEREYMIEQPENQMPSATLGLLRA